MGSSLAAVVRSHVGRILKRSGGKQQSHLILCPACPPPVIDKVSFGSRVARTLSISAGLPPLADRAGQGAVTGDKSRGAGDYADCSADSTFAVNSDGRACR